MANLAVVLIVMSNLRRRYADAGGGLRDGRADGQERRHRLRVFTRQALQSKPGIKKTEIWRTHTVS